MEGPLPNTTIPPLAIGRVEGYDITHHSLICTVPSWQEFSFPVRLLSNGPSDAYRIKQQDMPLRGTWGLIALVNGDSRAAFWLGSYNQSETNAYTQAAQDSTTNFDSQTEYNSHYSGTYELLDYLGNYFKRFADGTTIQVGETNTPPPIFNHQVELMDGTELTPAESDSPSASSGGTYQQITVPVQDSDRTPNPPAKSFYYDINHASEYQIQIAPNGTATIKMGANNNLTTIVLDINGNATLNLASGKKFNIGGPGFSDALVLVSKFIAEFNVHLHQDVEPGSGVSGPPEVPLEPSDVESQIIKITD